MFRSSGYQTVLRCKIGVLICGGVGAPIALSCMPSSIVFTPMS
jgi:hypothetical protein